MPEAPRALAHGRYQLGEPLGAGGAATVYRAVDTELGVARAVKLLVTEDSAIGDMLRSRLHAEARAMDSLRHPHVLAVHDVGEEGPVLWVVMDLAPGGSVMERVDRDGFVPLGQAIRWGVQLLSALGVAHAAGIVHRDVKPHNLLLDDEDRLLLADFGIALVTHDERRTQAGVALGSFAYMPPEQRVDAANVGPPADLYAVGATLYHLVTGESPMDLFQAKADDPRWGRLPPLLRPILRRACSTQPSARYESASAMSAELERALEVLDAAPTWAQTQPLTEERTLASRASTEPEPVSRPVATWTFALALAVAIVSLGLFWLLLRP